MKKDTQRLNITAHPLQKGSNSFSVPDFASFFDNIKKLMANLNCKDAIIKSVSCNSPLDVTVESEGHLHAVHANLNDLINSDGIPSGWGRDKIDSFENFLKPIGKSIGRLEISVDGFQNESPITLDIQKHEKFLNSIQEDYSAVGTIDGMLEAINIHGKSNNLTIYPLIGKGRITCEFKDEHLEKIKEFTGCYVEIIGEMKYRWRDMYPYSGVIHEIKFVDQKNLPSFSDLHGMAPNATNGMKSEDFVAKIRGEWESGEKE